MQHRCLVASLTSLDYLLVTPPTCINESCCYGLRFRCKKFNSQCDSVGRRGLWEGRCLGQESSTLMNRSLSLQKELPKRNMFSFPFLPQCTVSLQAHPSDMRGDRKTSLTRCQQLAIGLPSLQQSEKRNACSYEESVSFHYSSINRLLLRSEVINTNYFPVRTKRMFILPDYYQLTCKSLNT